MCQFCPKMVGIRCRVCGLTTPYDASPVVILHETTTVVPDDGPDNPRVRGTGTRRVLALGPYGVASVIDGHHHVTAAVQARPTE